MFSKSSAAAEVQRSCIRLDALFHTRGNFLMFQHLATFDLRQAFFDLADKPLVVTHQTLDCFMHQRFSVASRFSIFLGPTVPRTANRRYQRQEAPSPSVHAVAGNSSI